MKWLALLLLVGTTVAEARDRTGQFSVGGNLGLAFEAPWATPNFREAVGPGPKLTAFGRYHHDNSNSGFELSLDYFKLSQRTFASRSASLSYFWRFLPEGRFHPVFSIGAGASKAQGFFSTGDKTMPLYRLRVGAEWELNEKVDVSFHLDHLSLFKDQPQDPNAHALAPSVGLIYYFGEPPASVVPSEPAKPAVDTDADGDGVPSSLDRCPGTPKGAPVDKLGCAKEQSFELTLDVKFASKTATLAAGSDESIAELAQILKGNPHLRVEIQGHTDGSGTPAQNQPLSQHRANVVREELVRGHGIRPSRVVAKGYGESQPIASNKTAKGRAANRRVTAKIIQ